MIDLHCHLLPALDDGPRSMPEALTMARMAAGSGTTTMVATPHIDQHWKLDPADIALRAAVLSVSLAQEGIELQVLTGGEIALPRMADLSRTELELLRLGDGPYLLLECPLSPTAGDVDRIFLRLHARGQRILLAHPERCPLFQREPERLVKLVEAGLLCSITAGSMWGQFGGAVRGFTIELLRRGLVHDIASDSHDAHRRPPGLADAFEQAERELPGITAQREWLTRLAPAAILAGADLPPKPSLTPPPPTPVEEGHQTAMGDTQRDPLPGTYR